MERRDFLKNIGLLGFATSIAACASDGNSSRFKMGGNYPRDQIYGTKADKVNQKDVPYKSESVAIGNTLYHLQKVDFAYDGQLPFVIYERDDVTRIINRDSGEVVFRPTKAYIPQRAEVDGGTLDDYADAVPLRTTGPMGVRANIANIEELEKRIKRNGYLGVVITTEKDATFMLPTLDNAIEGFSYFIVKVKEDKQVNDGSAFNFYMIPAIGSLLEIENFTGQITIVNENSIYRPVLINSAQKARLKETEDALGETLLFEAIDLIAN